MATNAKYFNETITINSPNADCNAIRNNLTSALSGVVGTTDGVKIAVSKAGDRLTITLRAITKAGDSILRSADSVLNPAAILNALASVRG